MARHFKHPPDSARITKQRHGGRPSWSRRRCRRCTGSWLAEDVDSTQICQNIEKTTVFSGILVGFMNQYPFRIQDQGETSQQSIRSQSSKSTSASIYWLHFSMFRYEIYHISVIDTRIAWRGVWSKAWLVSDSISSICHFSHFTINGTMQVGCDQLSVDVTDLEWEICRTWGITIWSSVVTLSSQVMLPWNVCQGISSYPGNYHGTLNPSDNLWNWTLRDFLRTWAKLGFIYVIYHICEEAIKTKICKKNVCANIWTDMLLTDIWSRVGRLGWV